MVRTTKSSLGIHLSHFLKINANALAVKQYEVDVFQRGGCGRHKVTGNGLEDQLGCSLLREAIPEQRHIHMQVRWV